MRTIRRAGGRNARILSSHHSAILITGETSALSERTRVQHDTRKKEGKSDRLPLFRSGNTLIEMIGRGGEGETLHYASH